MVTSGANQAFINVLLTLCDEGDGVVLFTPYYFNHHMALQMTRGPECIVYGKCDPVSCHPSIQWLKDELAKPVRPKLVVLVNPCNPTGVLCYAPCNPTGVLCCAVLLAIRQVCCAVLLSIRQSCCAALCLTCMPHQHASPACLISIPHQHVHQQDFPICACAASL
jgi:bifunctional pyridoxal-dependent enzyme with beta-cystathionase and maltose regulon repressor activities